MDYEAVEHDRRKRKGFGRSHASALEKNKKERGTFQRRGSQKKRKDTPKKLSQRHSFSQATRRPIITPSHSTPEHPRLMACFDTPETQTSQRVEHWESFRQRFSNAECNTPRPKRGQEWSSRLGGCLWSSLVRVMSRRSDDTRDDVCSAYEWSGQRSERSFRRPSSSSSREVEDTQHQLFIVS